MSKPTKIHNKSVGSGGFGSDGDGIEEGRGDGGNGGVALVQKVVYTFKNQTIFCCFGVIFRCHDNIFLLTSNFRFHQRSENKENIFFLKICYTGTNKA
jgi:hypothetical protein